MLRFKNDVRIGGLTPQIVLAMTLADQVYVSNGVAECWVTSANDSKHKDGSKHYTGEAVDLRVHNIPDSPTRLRIKINLIARLASLGFDIVDEGDHFHIEYDPF